MNLHYQLRKTNQSTKTIKARRGFVIVTEEKAWIHHHGASWLHFKMSTTTCLYK